MKENVLPYVVLIGLVTFGCDRGKSDASVSAEPTATASGGGGGTAVVPSASAEPSAASAAATAPPASQIPTEEQYEKKATAAVTKANATQELDKLEKEIGR